MPSIRDAVTLEFEALLRRKGRSTVPGPDTVLRDIGFRSLDFSELALRVEGQLGRELNLEAATMRRIETVGDVIAFFEAAAETA